MTTYGYSLLSKDVSDWEKPDNFDDIIHQFISKYLINTSATSGQPKVKFTINKLEEYFNLKLLEHKFSSKYSKNSKNYDNYKIPKSIFETLKYYFKLKKDKGTDINDDVEIDITVEHFKTIIKDNTFPYIIPFSYKKYGYNNCYREKYFRLYY